MDFFLEEEGSVGQFLGIVLLGMVSEQKSSVPSWGLWILDPLCPRHAPVERPSSSHRFKAAPSMGQPKNE